MVENGFHYVNTRGSHNYYHKKIEGLDLVVQVVKGHEEDRQSRKTMDMSGRHSKIPKTKYKEWINS